MVDRPRRPSSASKSRPRRLRVPASAGFATAKLVEQADALCARGRVADARWLLERGLEARAAVVDPSRPSALLCAVARTHLLDGHADAALDCLEAALGAAEAGGTPSDVGVVLNVQAGVHFRLGRLEEAEGLFVRAHAESRAAGDLRLAAKTAGNLGIVASVRGDLAAALAHFDASLDGFRRVGQAHDVAYALNNRGMLLRRMDRPDDAARAFEEALHMVVVLGDSTTRALLHVNRAELALSQGRHLEAAAECDAAAVLARELHDDAVLGETHKLYGVLARERGDFREAEEQLRTGEALAERRQDALLLGETLRERAELHRRQGRNRDMFQCLNRSHRLFVQLRARRDLADVDGRMERLEDEFLRLARRWGDAIEAKDRFTQGHCERVADLACAIAERAGFDARALFWFRIGALLHDVGKIVIPAEVLNKPGKLSDEEWALVRSHPAAGVEMLADTEFPWDVRPIVESHHERWDGRGYPHGLSGEQIPLTARILGVADVYDALTSVRSYKRAMAHEEAIGILRQDVGTMFDPAVFAWFEDVAPAWRSRVEAQQPTPTSADASAAQLPPVVGTDPVTGLPGRAGLTLEATRVLDARRGTGRGTALLAMDVDGMAGYNAQLGRTAGDELLRRVAELLSRHTRASDFVARAVDDEFLVLLPDLDVPEARRMADRLRAAAGQALLAPSAASTDAPAGPPVSLCVGVAVGGGPFASADALVDSARAALRDAQRRGAGHLVVAT
jgi:diguanylate cyclase (GGDEF)-like protein/putative nucleotidyltransferase with HDIG domain